MTDTREPEKRYLPGHPDADEDGYVAYPAHESGRGHGGSAGRVAQLSGQRLGDLRGEGHDSEIAGVVPLSACLQTIVAQRSRRSRPSTSPDPDAESTSRPRRQAGSSFSDVLSSAINEVEGARNDANQSVRAISFRRRRGSAFHDSRVAARRPRISDVHAGAQQSGLRVPGNHEDADVGWLRRLMPMDQIKRFAGISRSGSAGPS